MTIDRNDPYLVLLRRELTRAQARLRRAERERDALRAALEKLRPTATHSKAKRSITKSRAKKIKDSK
jgi:hypothetical protein